MKAMSPRPDNDSSSSSLDQVIRIVEVGDEPDKDHVTKIARLSQMDDLNDSAWKIVPRSSKRTFSRLPSYDTAMRNSIANARAKTAERQKLMVARMEAMYSAYKSFEAKRQREHKPDIEAEVSKIVRSKSIAGSNSFSRTRFSSRREILVNEPQIDLENCLGNVLAGFAYMVILIWYICVFVDVGKFFHMGVADAGQACYFCFLELDQDFIYMLTIM